MVIRTRKRETRNKSESAGSKRRVFIFLVCVGIVSFSLSFSALSTFESESTNNIKKEEEAPDLPQIRLFGERPIDPILVESLAKISGGGYTRSNNFGQKDDDAEAVVVGWDINPKTVLESKTAISNNFQCKWLDFISTTGQKAKICGHSDGDLVTRGIEQAKRWKDCDVLPKMWNDATAAADGDNNIMTPNNSIYVEIGANIGSCVMEMLLSTDARIVAFEPHPRNQYVLLKSIEALDPSYQKRFVLVPVALGRETSINQIYASPRNMGNSVVGKVIKDWGGQKTEDFKPFDIYVERLSSILNVDADIDIPLIKLDAQGFECQILDGIDPNLAEKIHKVKFEVAPKWLNSQQCTGLFSEFRNLGFEIRSQDGLEMLEGETYQYNGIFDSLAVKVKKTIS